MAIATLTKIFASYFVNRDMLTGKHTSLVLPVKQAIEATIEKVAVSILQKRYYPLVVAIIDGGVSDGYMLPVYLLEIFLRYKRDRLANSLITDQSKLAFCILPHDSDPHSLNNKAQEELARMAPET